MMARALIEPGPSFIGKAARMVASASGETPW
jgi:hypothetical protein